MTGAAKTIVITGASSGIGKATAEFFAEKGWNVVATMREPATEKKFVETAKFKLVQLDVQNSESVRAAIAAASTAFGKIDVWVNNAGYGTFGPVEAATRDQIQRQYDVNVFGLIACVKAIAPHFRANRAGVLINITSTGGLMTAPGYSLYNSSKFAVEGLSEGLWYELRAFGVKVKVIEPGVIRTDFGGRSMDVLDISNLPDYVNLMEKVSAARARLVNNPSPPELVAAMIFEAANDRSDRLRYLVGPDAKRVWRIRRWLGYRTQMGIVRRLFRL